jgi:hypothetical protein
MIARTWMGTVHRADADEYAEYIRGRCCVAPTQGRLKANLLGQIAKTSRRKRPPLAGWWAPPPPARRVRAEGSAPRRVRR